jgi:hypothetical protein
MAWSYNGGTDKAYWTVPGAPVNAGCVAFWIKTTQTTTNTALVTYWNSTSRFGWGILLNNTANKITAAGYASSAQQVSIAGTTTVNDGNAHHVAFNFNRSSGGPNQLFVDGVSQGSPVNSGATWNPGTTGFVIESGKQQDAFWAAYVGKIWEMGHWGAQLSSDEIAALAKGFSPKLIRPSALGAYMPLVRDAHEVRAGLAIPTLGLVGAAADHGRSLGGGI